MPVTNGGLATAVQSQDPVRRHKTLASPALGAAASVLAAQTLPASGTTTVTAGITNPDVPRNLTVTGNQSTATGNVVVTGTSEDNTTITETIVANGTATVAGNKAFKTVTQVVFPARGASGDTISVGTGAKLGLGDKLARDTVRSAYLNNVREGTAPTVATSATAVESNTVQLNSALNGNQVDIYYDRG
jgi:hypothetical protein